MFQFLLRCWTIAESYCPKTAIRESMYPSCVPWNTRLICTPGIDKTNPLHSCQEVQVPVQTGTPSPQHLRPGLSAVIRAPPKNPPITVGPERAETHDKRVTSLPALISKYVLRVISLWPNHYPQQRTVLNRHRRDKCNLSLAQLPTMSKSKM
jgi:hypothetical protein